MSLPLKNITVVDLSRLIPGPFCSLILQELGARVIKVEDSGKPDYLRFIAPLVDANRGGAFFYALNHDKENLALNFESAPGQKILKQLAKKADVFIESSRPQVLRKMGIGPTVLHRVNPKLIVASITGYGQKGKYAGRAGHDLNYMSLSGLLTEGRVPEMQWADYVGGGLWGAIHIMAALLQKKNRTHLDISMTDNMIFTGLCRVVLDQFAGGLQNILSGILARYRLYQTGDLQWLSLAALEDKFWERFCKKIGKAEWLEPGKYPDASPAIHHELEKIFKSKTLSQWLTWAKKEDLCLTPVLRPKEVFASGPAISYDTIRGSKQSLKIPRLVKNKSQRRKIMPPALLGEHSHAILKELGYERRIIANLVRDKIVHLPSPLDL